MSRMFRLLLIILIPVLAAVGTFAYLRATFFSAINPEDSSPRLIEIKPEDTFSNVCDELIGKGVLRSCWGFNLMARLKGMDTKIRAGEYEMSPALRPTELLEKLVRGEFYKRIVLLKEGDSIWQLGKVVEKTGLLSEVEMNRGLIDPNLLVAAGIRAQSFEGYLFPETYYFNRPIDVHKILWRMLEESEKRWTEELSKRADELHMTRHEILTLASIIQKEAGNFEEMPKISSVFHNRLAQGMRLQSDPTVIYGIPNFDGNLTRAHLETPTPYNTYTNFGLPPGPICNPGEIALRAALYPEKTEYLFFVADGSGGHYFSKTLQEHNQAVDRYQRNKG